jgi:hypothetical protein
VYGKIKCEENKSRTIFNNDTMNQTYTSEEVKDLLLYVKETQSSNEELRAKIIAMDAMLKNEMAKNKQLKQLIQLYETNINN